MADHRIDDAGEIVHGARKHDFGHGLRSEDLHGLSPEEAAALVTKDNVWPQPDWITMAADGKDPVVIALSKIVRDRFPKRPNTISKRQMERSGEDIRADFIEMAGIVREAVDSMATKKDGSDLESKVLEAIGWYTGGWKDERVRRMLDVIDNGRRRYPFRISFDDVCRAERMVRDGFPSAAPLPAHLRGVRILKGPGGTVFAVRGNES